jgi:hypothetical protein
VTLVVDAAPLVALADRRDRMGGRVGSLLEDEPGELVIPAPVTAEVDDLLGRRLGRAARLAFLDDLAMGRFTVADLEPDDYRVVADLERRYDDLDVGPADLGSLSSPSGTGPVGCSPSTSVISGRSDHSMMASSSCSPPIWPISRQSVGRRSSRSRGSDRFEHGIVTAGIVTALSPPPLLTDGQPMPWR